MDVPPSPLLPSDEDFLWIGYVGRRGPEHFGLSRAAFVPFRAAVEAAVAAGTVFAVDWDVAPGPHAPGPEMLERLLASVVAGGVALDGPG